MINNFSNAVRSHRKDTLNDFNRPRLFIYKSSGFIREEFEVTSSSSSG